MTIYPGQKRAAPSTLGAYVYPVFEAVHMAELRCAELSVTGDKRGLATWKKVLEHVRGLATANPEEPATSH